MTYVNLYISLEKDIGNEFFKFTPGVIVKEKLLSLLYYFLTNFG
jgi:hypothetical protein